MTMAHRHGHDHGVGADTEARPLAVALGLILAFMAAEVALGTFTLERDFPACYSTVVVVYDVNGIPKPEVKHWLMDELDTAGELLSACDARCGARPPRCQAR